MEPDSSRWPFETSHGSSGKMEDLAMLKTLLAAVLGLFAFTANASQLVRLEVDQHADIYTVYVEMELDAPVERVRAILTDYAHLDRLNPSITASEIIDHEGGGTVRVLTRFENCILFLCLTVQRVEDITEDAQGRILVAMVPDASSFRSGQASWEVESTGSGSRVIHRARLEPDFWLPPWIGTAILKGTLRREIRASFERLECLARTDSLPHPPTVQTELATEHPLTVSPVVAHQGSDRTQLSRMAVKAGEALDARDLSVRRASCG
jgi:Polyketide cyclase / dehydrase and lipid transport